MQKFYDVEHDYHSPSLAKDSAQRSHPGQQTYTDPLSVTLVKNVNIFVHFVFCPRACTPHFPTVVWHAYEMHLLSYDIVFGAVEGTKVTKALLNFWHMRLLHRKSRDLSVLRHSVPAALAFVLGLPLRVCVWC